MIIVAKSPKHGEKSILIDDEDYDKIKNYNWFPYYDSHVDNYYIRANAPRNKGNSKTIFLHRFILNNPDNTMVDHINGDTLDNRKCNLRICTKSQNMMNRKKHKKCSSIFKGVCWNKQNKKFKAQIQIDNKKIYLGLYNSEYEAAEVYNRYARKHFGEFARLNQI